MPSEEEIVYFRRAFGLIDSQRRTRWLGIYDSSISQSRNGIIDWGLIPGLIPNHYGGLGYVKAVTRVTEILLEIIEANPNDEELQRKIQPLATQAKAIYEIRLGELISHVDEETGISGHDAACTAWQEAAAALGRNVEAVATSFTTDNCTTTNIVIAIIILIVVGYGLSHLR